MVSTRSIGHIEEEAQTPRVEERAWAEGCVDPVEAGSTAGKPDLQAKLPGDRVRHVDAREATGLNDAALVGQEHIVNR